MRASTTYLCLCLLDLLVRITLQATPASETYYIGAVVEYYPVTTGTNASAIASENAKNYVTVIKKAYDYGVDILVFPEGSLTTGLKKLSSDRTDYSNFSSYIPPIGSEVSCNNASSRVTEAVKTISCAAKTYSMYVVVNLLEKENCSGATSCPKDGYYFYNTNIIFNRQGRISSRYRKNNLFNEPGFNVTPIPNLSFLSTDFGVTFSHFICFDILFADPTLTLVRDHNITDFLFPTHWFSELPYFTSVQSQSAWSYSNNVNLLGASYNRPSTGSGGSGIYAGTSGVLNSLWSEAPTNVLLVARVPKLLNGQRTAADPSTAIKYTFTNAEISTINDTASPSKQILMRDNLEPYTTQPLDLWSANRTNISSTVCDRGLCCDFFVDVNRTTSIGNDSNYYRYRLAVFNGVRTYLGTRSAGVQICSVIACTGIDNSTCGRRFDANVIVLQPATFNKIVISGNFSTQGRLFQAPNSLTTSILPLDASDFSYAKTNLNSTRVNITLELISSRKDLLTFAIFGRNFDADGSPVTPAGRSSSDLGSSFAPYLLVALLLLVQLNIFPQ